MLKGIHGALISVLVLGGFVAFAIASSSPEATAGGGGLFFACRPAESSLRLGPREETEGDLSSDPVPGNSAVRTRAKRQMSRPQVAPASAVSSAAAPDAGFNPGSFGFAPRLRTSRLQPLHCVFLI